MTIPQIKEKIGKNYDNIGLLKAYLNIKWFKEEKIDEAVGNFCKKFFSVHAIKVKCKVKAVES